MPDLRDRNSRVVQQRTREIVNEAFLATLKDESSSDIDESFEIYDQYMRSLDEHADMADYDVDFDYDYYDYGDEYHRFDPEY